MVVGMKKGKLYLKRMISIVLLFSLPLAYNICTQFRFDADTQRLEAYYLEEPNSIDVVLLGASDVYSGYSPSYAYDKYKYTSYNYSIALNSVDLYAAQLKEILSTQSPDLILIEISSVFGTDKETEESVLISKHRMIDAVPESQNRKELIDSFTTLEDKISCYFPFFMYHGVSNMCETNINKISFSNTHQNLLKGVYIGVADYIWDDDFCSIQGVKTATEPSKECMKKINNLLKICDDENINVVFTRFPHRMTKAKLERFQYGNFLKGYLQKLGYGFLDFEATVEKNFDYYKDFTDGEHLNGVGQRKLTEQIGKILTENYGIKKRKLPEKCKKNWECSAEYIKLFYKFYDSIRETPNDELKKIYGEKHLWENKELIDALKQYNEE